MTRQSRCQQLAPGIYKGGDRKEREDVLADFADARGYGDLKNVSRRSSLIC